MFDFLKIRDSVNSLAAEVQGIRSDIEQKKQRREDLQTLPIPKAEMVAEIGAWIDAQNDATREHAQRVVNQLLNRPTKPLQEFNIIPLLSNPADGRHLVGQQHLLLMLGDLIKDQLPAWLDRIDYPEVVGPPRAERMAELVKLDKEIDKLERQEAELLEQAAQAGIQIAPLGKLSTVKG